MYSLINIFLDDSTLSKIKQSEDILDLVVNVMNIAFFLHDIIYSHYYYYQKLNDQRILDLVNELRFFYDFFT